MTTSKQSLKEKILINHRDMRDACIKIGINEQKYDKLVENLDALKQDELSELQHQLQGMRNSVYQHYQEIYNLLPEETWNKYKLHGLTHLRECVLLREAEKNIKAFFKEMTSYH